MRTALLSLLTIFVVTACTQEFRPLSPPDLKITPPTSTTVAQPAPPPRSSGCPGKVLAQNLLGQWAYTSNHLVNPRGGSAKYSGRIVFKTDMSFEDPDNLFGSQIESEVVLARLYELQGDTLRIYVTDKTERQQGIILALQTSDCANLKFVGIGKGSNVSVELKR